VLLSHLGLSTPLRSLHEHNERERTAEVLAALDDGADVALISDAGTPALSDPGADLVAAAAEAGHAVSPVPGPSALAAALSVAGFRVASTDVLFLGFLPAKGKARRASLDRIAAQPGVVVLYEGPHRVPQTLADLAGLDGTRPACLCRELTKIHEEILRGRVADLAAAVGESVRGEVTLVLGPREVTSGETTDGADADVDAALRRCLAAGLSARDAATAVAAVLERPRRKVYERSLALRR
jgi:16S rRNA (cytidine1402-2'-O)-methyltransferase